MKVRLSLAVFFAVALTACDETSKLEEVVLPVSAEETANFPRVPVKVDTTLNLRVLFRPDNGCGRFSRADSVVSTHLTEIRLFAAYPSDDLDAVCTDISKLISFPFKFRTTTPGKHYFRFWRNDNTFLLDSVEVK